MDEHNLLLREKYKGEKTAAFFEDVRRLEEGEPLAYIIGSIPFHKSTIYLDSRPLIPRPETEFWVEDAIREIDAHHGDPAVLDLCAGSGCIGVAVLMAVQRATVDFTEIDAEHHETIAKNLRENNIDMKRARIFGGDLFQEITRPYDFILSNPPYIDPLLDRAEMSVKAHEPHSALYGGEHGTEILEGIIHQAPHFLTDKGVLYIEHEPEQIERIHAFAEAYFDDVESFEDQYAQYRYTRLTRRKPALM